MFKGNYQIVSLTSDGAARNIELGFSPVYAKATNIATGATLEWFAGMTGAIQTTAAGAKTIVAGALVAFDGVEGTTSKGVTLAVNATVNISGNGLRVEAIGME